jgi:nitrogen fixation NifU-like protein
MDRQSQIESILEHYENPRHYGSMVEATVSRKGSNPGCGDVVTFYLQVNSSGQIMDISFEAEGCTISRAAASMAAEICAEKTLTEVVEMPASAILEMLGPDIASTRLRCATLGLNTVKEAARAVRRNRRDSDDV